MDHYWGQFAKHCLFFFFSLFLFWFYFFQRLNPPLLFLLILELAKPDGIFEFFLFLRGSFHFNSQRHCNGLLDFQPFKFFRINFNLFLVTLSFQIGQTLHSGFDSWLIFFRAYNSSSLFLVTITFLKDSKLSQSKICLNILASLQLLMPLMIHFSSVFYGMPTSSIMLQSSKAVNPINSWKILVYQNLFSSASQKRKELSSIKSSNGFLQIGEVRYCLTQSYTHFSSFPNSSSFFSSSFFDPKIHSSIQIQLKIFQSDQFIHEQFLERSHISCFNETNKK